MNRIYACWTCSDAFQFLPSIVNSCETTESKLRMGKDTVWRSIDIHAAIAIQNSTSDDTNIPPGNMTQTIRNSRSSSSPSRQRRLEPPSKHSFHPMLFLTPNQSFRTSANTIQEEEYADSAEPITRHDRCERVDVKDCHENEGA